MQTHYHCKQQYLNKLYIYIYMNETLQKLFITSFENGNITHLLDKFKDENNDSTYNLYKGLIYLNLKKYHSASKYFYKGIENDPSNTMIYNNLTYLPLMYQKKKYIITIEGHLHTTHSFGVLFRQFIKSLQKLECVDLRIKHIPTIGKNDDEYISLYNNRNTISDLTIRLCIPVNDVMVGRSNYFNCSENNDSKYTLVFVVTEGINVRSFKHYNNNVYIMTPSEYSKKCFIETHPNFSLKEKIKVIPHGIDYSNHIIFNYEQILESRLKYSIHNEFVFLHISGNSRNKNVGKIIQAFLKLPQKNIKLLIKINSYNNIFKKHPFQDIINDNVIIIQENFNDQEMNELYNIYDCYVSASSAEGFNMTVLEAGSYGKIVICPDNSPTDEFTYQHGTIKINTTVLSSKMLNVTISNIYDAMYKAIHTKITPDVKNAIIVHHLQYNWDIIIKKMIDYYCSVNDDYSHIKTLISFNKNEQHEFHMDKYYNSIVKHNISNLMYNDFITKNLTNIFIELYLYLFSKNKINFIKPVITSISNAKLSLTERIYFSVNLDTIINIIPYLNNNKIEHDFCSNTLLKISLDNYICILPELYFFSTYISNDISKHIKYNINQSIQTMWKSNNISVTNNPKKKNNKYRICIIAAKKDFIDNAVYRFIKYQIQVLSELFYIDIFVIDNIEPLIEVRKNIENALTISIDNIYNINFSTDINFYYKLYNYTFKNTTIHKDIINFDKILNNEYLCCYIPVMGCNIGSIYLSNLRIAPIQFSGYGHPISSFGSKNNYFIVSKDIECLKYIDINYSEKKIYVNGLTTIPIYIPFTSYNSVHKEDNTILISSNFKKITHQFLNTIKTICKEYYINYKKKLLIKFFPGHSRKYKYSEDCCDKCIESEYYDYVFNMIPDQELYMREKYTCKLALDSYPYGGCTTILENLNLHIPTIVYAGNEAVNNFPRYIYTFFNLDELIVYSYDEYITLAYRLLTDHPFYNAIYKKIKLIDLTLLYSVNIKNSILSSFNTLIEEYEQ
jgi:hypothetical protein